MRRVEYDWKTLAELGAAEIVDGLQRPLARNVDPWLIAPAFGEVLRADGLDPECPMTVRWVTSPPHQDLYLFEQEDRETEEFATL